MANLVEQGAVEYAAQLAQKGGVLAAGGFGTWAWLAENAQAIGAACALGGLVIAAFGAAVNWYYKHKASKGPRA